MRLVLRAAPAGEAPVRPRAGDEMRDVFEPPPAPGAEATGPAIPTAVRFRTADGVEREVTIAEIAAGAIFVETPFDQLQYAEPVDVEFLVESGAPVSFQGIVSVMVRGRGVRIEAASDTPPEVLDVIAAWAAGEPAELSPPREGRPASPTGRGLAGTRVLVIDDDSLVLMALERFLGHLGCVVLSTSDPSRALPILAEQEVDAVLLDWILPQVRGSEMLAQILSAHGSIPVAVISGGLWWQNAERELYDMGAQAVLRKPLDIDEVARWLSTLASARRRAPRPSARAA